MCLARALVAASSSSRAEYGKAKQEQAGPTNYLMLKMVLSGSRSMAGAGRDRPRRRSFLPPFLLLLLLVLAAVGFSSGPAAANQVLDPGGSRVGRQPRPGLGLKDAAAAEVRSAPCSVGELVSARFEGPTQLPQGKGTQAAPCTLDLGDGSFCLLNGTVTAVAAVKRRAL